MKLSAMIKELLENNVTITGRIIEISISNGFKSWQKLDADIVVGEKRATESLTTFGSVKEIRRFLENCITTLRLFKNAGVFSRDAEDDDPDEEDEDEEDEEYEEKAIDHEEILSDAIDNLPDDMKDHYTSGYVNEAGENDGRYEEEYIFRMGELFGMSIEAGGWFAVDEDGDVSCTLTLAFDGDWDKKLLGEYGCINGWYDADSNSWSFSQDTF